MTDEIIEIPKNNLQGRLKKLQTMSDEIDKHACMKL